MLVADEEREGAVSVQIGADVWVMLPDAFCTSQGIVINYVRVICQLTDVSAHFGHTSDCQFDDKMEITDKRMEFGLKN